MKAAPTDALPTGHRRMRRLNRLTVGKALLVAFLVVLSLSMVLPFVHEMAKSLSQPSMVASGRVSLWPVDFTIGNYSFYYRRYGAILARAFLNSVIITVLGTLWTVVNTAIFSFPLSRPKREFRLTRAVMLFIIFIIVFQRPLIPYFLTVRAYGLMNSLGAIIFTHTIMPFFMILYVTFFRGLPQDLFDACRMDGGGDLSLLFRVAMPLSKAVTATVGLYMAVIMWNIFLHAKLFIQNVDLMPLQVFVRGVLESGADSLDTVKMQRDPFAGTDSSKSAIVMISTIPMVIVYPFIQRYFTKGSMIGALIG